MKSISTRFNLIVGVATLMLGGIPLGFVSGQTPMKGDPDRPVILGRIPNQNTGRPKANAAQPQLTIKRFLFPPNDDQALRVHVANTGKAAATACRLVLRVTEINGVAVSRKTHVKVFSPLAAGADVWLVLDAGSILPKNVSLQTTTFRLNIYPTEMAEASDEANNERWQAQLDFTAATPRTPARHRIVDGYSAEFYGGSRNNSGDKEPAETLNSKNTAPTRVPDSYYGSGVYKSTDGGKSGASDGPTPRGWDPKKKREVPVSGQAGEQLRVKGRPDLQISEYVFRIPRNDDDVKVFVVADGNARPQARSASKFALVAASFKNAGGNYNLINGDKVVLVHVLNAGNGAATPCRLKLTVRKINGVPVGRERVATVAALAPGQDLWVMVDAASILPNNIKLDATTFKLNVDATEIIAESNESNNEAWHNQ
jgi:hypothetical protein